MSRSSASRRPNLIFELLFSFQHNNKDVFFSLNQSVPDPWNNFVFIGYHPFLKLLLHKSSYRFSFIISVDQLLWVFCQAWNLFSLPEKNRSRGMRELCQTSVVSGCNLRDDTVQQWCKKKHSSPSLVTYGVINMRVWKKLSKGKRKENRKMAIFVFNLHVTNSTQQDGGTASSASSYAKKANIPSHWSADWSHLFLSTKM